jgi:hypothetical protein
LQSENLIPRRRIKGGVRRKNVGRKYREIAKYVGKYVSQLIAEFESLDHLFKDVSFK